MMTLPMFVSSPASKRVSLQSHPSMRRYVRRFLALGMSKAEAQRLARAMVQYTVTKRVKGQQRSLKMRQLMPVYWRRLIEVGVPLQNAQQIAEIIAAYDVLRQVPSPYQLALLKQHCRYICRAELWRPKLLMVD